MFGLHTAYLWTWQFSVCFFQRQPGLPCEDSWGNNVKTAFPTPAPAEQVSWHLAGQHLFDLAVYGDAALFVKVLTFVPAFEIWIRVGFGLFCRIRSLNFHHPDPVPALIIYTWSVQKKCFFYNLVQKKTWSANNDLCLPLYASARILCFRSAYMLGSRNCEFRYFFSRNCSMQSGNSNLLVSYEKQIQATYFSKVTSWDLVRWMGHRKC